MARRLVRGATAALLLLVSVAHADNGEPKASEPARAFHPFPHVLFGLRVAGAYAG